MSIKAMNWAWDAEELPLRESMVLLVLADWADRSGDFVGDLKMLAHKTGFSSRMCVNALGGLVRRKYVSVSNWAYPLFSGNVSARGAFRAMNCAYSLAESEA